MKIQKRDGRIVPYEADKIAAAIHKANNEVEEKERDVVWRAPTFIIRGACCANPTRRMSPS
jgi:hypothetical protein